MNYDYMDSKFIKKYKKEMVTNLLKMNPDWDEEEVEKIVKKEILKTVQNPIIDMDNNYTGEHSDATLLTIFDWTYDRKPLIAGNATFYKNQHEAINPVANMLNSMLTKRKAFKKQMFAIEDASSQEYKDLDLKQANEKINCNSYYGASGAPTSAFFSQWSGPATTGTAQSVISCAYTTFEAFAGDNYIFLDLNECITWLNVVLNEDVELDYFVKRHTAYEVFERLRSKFYNYKNKYDEPLMRFLENLSPDELTRIYYKNNLIEFTEDHPEIIFLHRTIFESILNLSHVDEKDPEWFNKTSDLVSKDFKDAKAYNKYVNIESFFDPNELPSTVEKEVKELANYYMKYVYVRYHSFDRIHRLKNFKRKIVKIIDTDSNILALDDWVDFVKQRIMTSDYGRSDENNIFIIVNTLTYSLTSVVQDILLSYGEHSNIPEEYRSRFNMKNEFFFTKLAIGDTKKRYLSYIKLREGNLLVPAKPDVKGFDFKKATTSEEMEKFCMDNVIEHILKPEGVDARELYKSVSLKRQEILDSIKAGEVRYLPNANAKEISAYKNPESEQSVRGSIAWNMLSPHNIIEFPAKVKMLKLKIFKESDIDDLMDTYPEMYNLIMEKIFNDTTGLFVSYSTDSKGKTVKKSRGLQVLAIPTNDVIPDWCKPYIDYTSMVNNIVSPFKSVMELLKFQHTEEGKTHNGISRKSDRLTNVIRI